MLSQTTEYALRAIICLAEGGVGVAQTVEDIARATAVPARYLAKVMQVLARAQLVASQRGPHGGFALLRPPAALTVYDVVQAVGPIVRTADGPPPGDVHTVDLVLLHRGLEDAMAGLESAYRRLSIQGLLRRRPHTWLPGDRPDQDGPGWVAPSSA